MSGKISIPEKIENEELNLPKLDEDKTGTALNTSDVYKELCLRGYDNGGLFRGVTRADTIYLRVSKRLLSTQFVAS